MLRAWRCMPLTPPASAVHPAGRIAVPYKAPNKQHAQTLPAAGINTATCFCFHTPIGLHSVALVQLAARPMRCKDTRPATPTPIFFTRVRCRDCPLHATTRCSHLCLLSTSRLGPLHKPIYKLQDNLQQPCLPDQVKSWQQPHTNRCGMQKQAGRTHWATMLEFGFLHARPYQSHHLAAT